MLNAELLQETIYDLNWYDYSVDEQKLVHIWMTRLMRRNAFSAFGFIHCDLKTFADVSILHKIDWLFKNISISVSAHVQLVHSICLFKKCRRLVYRLIVVL